MKLNQSKTILLFLMALAIGEIGCAKTHNKIQKDESSQNSSSVNSSVPSIKQVQEMSVRSPDAKQVLHKKENKIMKKNSVDIDEDSQRNQMSMSHPQSVNKYVKEDSSSISQRSPQKAKKKKTQFKLESTESNRSSVSMQTVENIKPKLLNNGKVLVNNGKSGKVKDMTHKPNVGNKSHRSNPLTGESTIRSMTKLLKGEDSKPCKKQLLSLFGVKGTLQENSIKATPMEKSYCFRNSQSCCSAYNIESTNKEFSKGVLKLKNKFEVLEELFAMFRGPKFFDLISAYKEKSNCKSHVEDLQLELEGQTYKYFDETYQMYQKEMMDMVLMDTEMYFKKNIWFYGDSICSICNPKTQNYFEITKQGSTLAVNVNMCSERIEEKEYERNLLLIYERHISPTVKFVDCVLEEDEAEEVSANSENDAKEVLELIDSDERNTFLKLFDKCILDKAVEEEDCQNFCRKPLAWYQFPIDNLMHNYKVSLAILYKSMNEGEISEYYDEIKGMEWKIQDENEPINFYKVSSDWEEYKMEEIEWTFHKKTGHNVYREIMSKRYLHYSFEEEIQSVKLLSSILIGVMALLF